MENSTLEYPYWTKSDVQELKLPTEEEQANCDTLTRDFIAWIETYEQNIVDCLGIEYRQKTLIKWDNGERKVISPELMINEWKDLGIAISK